jgi:hypothetical protein
VLIGERFRGPYREFVQEMPGERMIERGGDDQQPKLRAMVAKHFAGRLNQHGTSELVLPHQFRRKIIIAQHGRGGLPPVWKAVR